MAESKLVQLKFENNSYNVWSIFMYSALAAIKCVHVTKNM